MITLMFQFKGHMQRMSFFLDNVYALYYIYLILPFVFNGLCDRFYVLVRTLRQNKQLAEWLIYWDSSSKLYHHLLLLLHGHLCSHSNRLHYNPSFLHSFHCLYNLHHFFIASWLGIWCIALLGNKRFPVWWSLFVTHSFCHKMVSIIHSCMVFYSSNMVASVLRMQSQLWLERELPVECVYYEC